MTGNSPTLRVLGRGQSRECRSTLWCGGVGGVGKTFLLTHFATAKRAVYFTATRQDSNERQLARLTDRIREQLGGEVDDLLHLDQCDQSSDVETNLRELAYEPAGILVRDAMDIIGEDLDWRGGYERVLAAIGFGAPGLASPDGTASTPSKPGVTPASPSTNARPLESASTFADPFRGGPRWSCV